MTKSNINPKEHALIPSGLSEYQIPGTKSLNICIQDPSGFAYNLFYLPKSQIDHAVTEGIQLLRSEILPNKGADDDCCDYIPDYLDQLVFLASQESLEYLQLTQAVILKTLADANCLDDIEWEPAPQQPVTYAIYLSTVYYFFGRIASL